MDSKVTQERWADLRFWVWVRVWWAASRFKDAWYELRPMHTTLPQAYRWMHVQFKHTEPNVPRYEEDEAR